MKNNELYKKAIDRWGYAPQVRMTIEECAELIKALAKIERNTNYSTIDDVLEEMVDVEIMLGQLKLIFDYMHNDKYIGKISRFDDFKEQKLRRLRHLLND